MYEILYIPAAIVSMYAYTLSIDYLYRKMIEDDITASTIVIFFGLYIVTFDMTTFCLEKSIKFIVSLL